MGTIFKLLIVISIFFLTGCYKDYDGTGTDNIMTPTGTTLDMFVYDSGFIVPILDGVATIFDSDSGITSFFGIGILFSFLIMGIKGALTGKYEIMTFVAGMFLFSIMFVPKVAVTITEYNTLNTQRIANVPWGAAVVGTFSSNIGKSLTDLYNQHFTTPNMYQVGFISPLRILTDIIDIGSMASLESTTGSYSSANNTYTNLKFANFDKSLNGYVKNCVIKDMFADTSDNQNRTVTRDKLNQSGDSWAAMEVKADGVAWNTIIYFDPQNPGDSSQYGPSRVVTCAEAYNGARPSYLGNATAGSSSKGLSYFIKGPEGAGTTSSELYQEMLKRLNAIYKPNAAINLMGSDITDTTSVIGAIFASNANAYQFMKNGYLKWQTDRAFSDSSLTANLAEYSAIKQRQMQFASERSMFAEMALPTAAFIQAIIFFAAPLIAFAMLLGPIGVGLAVKYLQLALWVSTWDVMMSVINLFTYTSFQKKMAELANQLNDNALTAKAITSFDNIEKVYTEANSFIAVASNLAAAAPIITYALITGGSYALVSAVNRVTSSGDHFNEKSAAPDMVDFKAGVATGGNSMMSMNNSRLGDGTYAVSKVTNGAAELSSNQISNTAAKGNGVTLNSDAKEGNSLSFQQQASQSFANVANSVLSNKSSTNIEGSNTSSFGSNTAKTNGNASSNSNTGAFGSQLNIGGGYGMNNNGKGFDPEVAGKTAAAGQHFYNAGGNSPVQKAGAVAQLLKGGLNMASSVYRANLAQALGLGSNASNEEIANKAGSRMREIAEKDPNKLSEQDMLVSNAVGTFAINDYEKNKEIDAATKPEASEKDHEKAAENFFMKMLNDNVEGVKTNFNTMLDGNASEADRMIAAGKLALTFGSLNPAGMAAKLGIKSATAFANNFDKIVAAGLKSNNGAVAQMANLVKANQNQGQKVAYDAKAAAENIQRRAEKKALEERIPANGPEKNAGKRDRTNDQGKPHPGKKESVATKEDNALINKMGFLGGKLEGALKGGFTTSLMNTEQNSQQAGYGTQLTSQQVAAFKTSMSKTLDATNSVSASKTDTATGNVTAEKRNSNDSTIGVSSGYRKEESATQGNTLQQIQGEARNEAAILLLANQYKQASSGLINDQDAVKLAKQAFRANTDEAQSAISKIANASNNDINNILAGKGGLHKIVNDKLNAEMKPELSLDTLKQMAYGLAKENNMPIQEVNDKINEMMKNGPQPKTVGEIFKDNQRIQGAIKDAQSNISPQGLYSSSGAGVNAHNQAGLSQIKGVGGYFQNFGNGGIDAAEGMNEINQRNISMPTAGSISINPNAINELSRSIGKGGVANLLSNNGFNPNSSANDMFGALGMINKNDMKFGSEASAKAFLASIGSTGAKEDEKGNKDLSNFFQQNLRDNSGVTWDNSPMKGGSQEMLRTMLNADNFSDENIAEYRKQREKEKGILSTQASDGQSVKRTGDVTKPTDKDNVMKAEDLKLNNYVKEGDRVNTGLDPVTPVPLPSPTSENDRGNVNEFDPAKIIKDNPPSAGISQATNENSITPNANTSLVQGQGDMTTSATLTPATPTAASVATVEQSAVKANTTPDSGMTGQSKVFGETLSLNPAQNQEDKKPGQNIVTSQPTTDNGIVPFEQSKFNDAVALKTTVGDNGQIEMSRVQISTGKEEVFFKGDMTMGAESAEALTNERLNQANKNNEVANEPKGDNFQPKKIEQMKSDNVNYGTTNKDTSYPVSSVESIGQGNATVNGLSANTTESVSRTPMNMNYDVEQGVVTSNGVPTGFGEPIRLNNEEHYEATNQNFNESQISESRDIGTNDTADNIKSINVNGVWHLAVENNDGTYTKINLKDNS